MGRKKVEEEEETFQVEVITQARVASAQEDSEEESSSKKSDNEKNDARWEYHVKWAGYGWDAQTWEPEANLFSCQRLLKSFWSNTGLDGKDYNIGDVVTPSKEWIKQEQQFFREKVQKDLKMKRKRKSSKKGTTRASKRRSSESVRQSTAANDKETVASDDESIDSGVAGRAGKRRKVMVSESEDDEDDVPLKVQLETKTKVAAKTPTPPPPDPSPAPSPNSLFGPEPDEDESPLLSSPPSRPKHPTQPKPAERRGSSIMSIDSPRIPTAHQSTATKITMRRRTDPHTSFPGNESAVIASAGGISTKSKLAKTALTPVAPKGASFDALQKPSSKLSALSGLSFRKTKTSSQDWTSRPAPMVSSPQAMSPAVESSSPIPLPLPGRNRITQPIQPQIAPANEVDSFLGAIMPEQLSAPLRPAASPTIDIQVPGSLRTSLKVTLPGRTQKTWSWEGPLVLGDEEPICTVKIHEPSETKGSGMKFSILLENVDRLAPTVHDAADIHLTLGAFKEPSQTAVLGPSNETDVAGFSYALAYFERTRKVLLQPAYLDKKLVGYILFFSPNFDYLWGHIFGATPQPDQAKYFASALLMYTLPPDQAAFAERPIPKAGVPHLAVDPALSTSARVKRITSVPAHHTLSHGPKTSVPWQNYAHSIYPGPDFGKFFQWLHVSVRTCALFPPYPTTGFYGQEALDRRAMHAVLEQANTKLLKLEDKPRFFLVHTSGLETIHRLPALADRRRDCRIRFYLSGVSPYHDKPGTAVFREFYTLGGVVTFTPSLLRDDPFAVNDLISKLDRHPLYCGYIHPLALGIITMLAYPKGDALQALDHGTFAYDYLLKAISEGSVALMTCPPKKDSDAMTKYASNFVSLLPPTPRRALQIALEEFEKKKFDKIPERKWMSEADVELKADMWGLMRHPAFMFNRRRFVVLYSQWEPTPVHKEGIEWSTVQAFDFMDDFFPKQSK